MQIKFKWKNDKVNKKIMDNRVTVKHQDIQYPFSFSDYVACSKFYRNNLQLMLEKPLHKKTLLTTQNRNCIVEIYRRSEKSSVS